MDLSEPRLKDLALQYFNYLELIRMLLRDMVGKENQKLKFLCIHAVSNSCTHPKNSAMKSLKELVNASSLNYPDTVLKHVFVCSNKVSDVVRGILKELKPAHDVFENIQFVEEENAVVELLRFVNPSIIMQMQGLVEGEHSEGLSESSLLVPRALPHDFEVNVQAGNVSYNYIDLETTNPAITWTHQNWKESTKSTIRAKIYYFSDRAGKVVVIDDVRNRREARRLPDVTECVVELEIDHSKSWIHSHLFKVRLERPL